MLAQNFKSAADLGIEDAELDALIKVLGMLEREEIGCGGFNMGVLWMDDPADCGTVGCLCGWANHVSRGNAFSTINNAPYPSAAAHALARRIPRNLAILFNIDSSQPPGLIGKINAAMPESAALAVRSYLTTGEANWAEALT